MRNHWFFGYMLTLVLLFSLPVTGGSHSLFAAAAPGLKPGDKIGTMTIVKGPPTFDMTAIPPWPAFCNANPDPTMKPGDKMAKPGVYTVECTMPPLPKFHIGSGWTFADEKRREADWSAVHQEMYLNGQPIDQTAFGSVDVDVPNQLPVKDASKVSMVKLRVWNVVLENLSPGSLTLRNVTRIDKPFPHLFSPATISAGIYDITYKITVLTEQEAANQAVIQGFYDQVINQRHFDRFPQFFVDKVDGHDLGPMFSDIMILFNGIPNLHVTVDHWFVKEDIVTSVVSFTGTQDGEMMGVAPTHKKVTWTHVDVHRIKDGKIVEYWHNIPYSDILQQLGYQLTPPANAAAASQTTQPLDPTKLQQAHDQVLAATGKYRATEQIVNFPNQGQKIVGTLTLPSGGDQPYPVVLLLHGFAADRNWLPITGTQEGIFGRTGRILAEHGVASLRIDFRGSGESDGAFADMTYSGEIADTIAAMDYLATRPEVDSQRLALLGLSGGGLVAAETAARDPRVQSLLLWSPVANTVDNLKGAVGAENVTAGLQSTDKPVHIVLPFGEIDLKKTFFDDLYKLDPIAAIRTVKRPLLVVVGLRDQAIIPQPQYGQLYLNYHDGPEQLVTVDGDHVFDALTDKGPLVLDDVIAWSLAWLQKTL